MHWVVTWSFSWIAQVNFCHEEQLAKLKQEMHKIIASKDEQIALLQLGNKELTDLQEEIQAKNQQVKQYKKQVDSYKAELERCQGEMLEVNVMGTMII